MGIYGESRIGLVRSINEDSFYISENGDIMAVADGIVNFGMTIVSVLFCAFMNCLELLVACLQAYIFTLLSANYIGLAKVRE